MTDTHTREERMARLDEFANLKTQPDTGTELATVSHGPPSDYIHGAQLVQNPRDEMRVLQRIKVLAAGAGEGWYYRFPVKDNKTGRTSWIEGPSVKLANAVALIYGNCEIDVRAQDLGSAIMLHARFFDVENGFAYTRPFQQRKGVSRLGGADEGRRDDATFQIGVSKAARNVVVNSLQTYCDFAFEEAKDAIVDKIGKDLPKWRGKIVERFSAKVDIKRVEAVIGRQADKWLAPDIARIIAMGKAIEDGMASMDETFPPLGTTSSSTSDEAAKNVDRLDEFAAGKVDEPAAAESPSANGDGQTAADANSPTQAAVDPIDDRQLIIARLLQIATDSQPVEERLERLDLVHSDIIFQHPKLETFIKEVTKTAVKVARGDLKAPAARKFLEGLA